MNAYTTFAQVYDLFMDNVPYEEWSKYIISVSYVTLAVERER